MHKSFITFYLFQYHKKSISGRALYLYLFHLKNGEEYFPYLVKDYSKITAFGYLEGLGNRNGMYLEKKATRKKYFNV